MSAVLTLEKIDSRKLNGRQKESYNFQKISGILADYGFTTILLRDDWNGADFIAQHADGKTVLRVQLKGRLQVNKKYMGKDLWLCFPATRGWYLGLHDEILGLLLTATGIGKTKSWSQAGSYGYPTPPKQVTKMLERFLRK